jgi:4,5-dihydroxyphthalate decarboxylase
MNLPLTLAISPYDHARGLAAQGIDLAVLELPIEEIFFRFTKFREWHASEMSFGKTVSMMAQEVPAIMPIPVFPSRVFRHSAIYLAEKSDIQRPKDLEGRKVGIPEWAQTAGIYVRGLLQHEYGVDLARIQWYQAGVQQPGRIEKVKLHLPEGLRITAVPDKSLAGMLASGELDAVISARDPGGRRLFENYQDAEEAYFRKTRIYPIMHLVVLRRDAWRNRWIAMNRGGTRSGQARKCSARWNRLARADALSPSMRGWRGRGLLALRHRAKPAASRAFFRAQCDRASTPQSLRKSCRPKRARATRSD